MLKNKMRKAPKTLILLFLIVTFGIMNVNPIFAQTGHWEQIYSQKTPAPRQGHAIATLGNGRVVLFGGTGINGSASVYYSDTWLFDNNTRTWTELYPKLSPAKRYYHRMCQLSENKILLFGGAISNLDYFSDTWIFNLDDTSWTKIETKNYPSARCHFGMSQITTNTVLLFGGIDYTLDIQNDTWIFDYEKNNWKEYVYDNLQRQIPSYRLDPMLALLDSNKVILFGGRYYEDYSKDTWLFDLDSVKWLKQNSNGMSDSIAHGGMCQLFQNKLLMFGGSNGLPQNKSWLYDYNNTIWILLNTDKKPPVRIYTDLAKLDNGVALLFGGVNTTILGDTWLFLSDMDEVDEKQNNSQFISPNPAMDFIEIDFTRWAPLAKWSPSVEIRIFNVLGEIQTTTLLCDTPPYQVGEKVRIDVSGLAPGMYFVRIGDRVGKFVKM